MSEQIPIKSDKLWYRCIDVKIAYVDPLCYHESGHVRKHLERIEEEDKQPVPPGMMSVWRNYLDDNNKFGHSPIPVQISSDILSIVKDFCVSRCQVVRCHLKKKKARLTKKLHDFDVDFVGKKPRLSLLVRLMDAAFQLEIPSLLHITSEAIVHMLKSEQKLLKKKKFLKIFNLPDFTHDVWKDPSIGACFLESTSAGRQQPATASLAQLCQVRVARVRVARVRVARVRVAGKKICNKWLETSIATDVKLHIH